MKGSAGFPAGFIKSTPGALPRNVAAVTPTFLVGATTHPGL